MKRLTIPFRLLPRSLFGRLALILFSGLAAAHVLSLALLMYERSQTAGATMIAYLTKDVASSVAILERVPAGERPQWLPKIERKNYRYSLDRHAEDVPANSLIARNIAGALSRELADKAFWRSYARGKEPFQAWTSGPDGGPSSST